MGELAAGVKCLRRSNGAVSLALSSLGSRMKPASVYRESQGECPFAALPPGALSRCGRAGKDPHAGGMAADRCLFCGWSGV